MWPSAAARAHGAAQPHPQMYGTAVQLGLKPQRNGSVLQEAVPSRTPAVEKERDQGGAILSMGRTKVLCLETPLGAEILPAALG